MAAWAAMIPMIMSAAGQMMKDDEGATQFDPYAQQRQDLRNLAQDYRGAFINPNRQSRAYNRALDKMQKFASGDYMDPESNPWLREYADTIKNAMREEQARANERLMSNIRKASGGSGASSQMMGEYGRQRTEQAEDVGEQINKLYYQNYQDQMNKMFRGTQALSQMARGPWAQLGNIYGQQGGGTRLIQNRNQGVNWGQLGSQAMNAYYNYKASQQGQSNY